MQEKNKMTLESFYTYMQVSIQEKMGSNYKVVVGEVEKNNGVRLNGLSIKKMGTNIAPTIYMEEPYQRYLEDRNTLDELEEHIMECYYANATVGQVDMKKFMNWEQVKDRIVYKIVNYEKNEELLKKIPYIKVLDLAVVFYYLLDEQMAGGFGSITIHNEHLEHWEKSIEDVHSVAIQNTPRILKCKLQDMESSIKEMSPEEFACYDFATAIPMFVLTNQRNFYGAATILYPNVLKDLAKFLESDLYILPSSTHEVILVPANKVPYASSELTEMVQDINDVSVPEIEILSDHVYKFDRLTGCITF